MRPHISFELSAIRNIALFFRKNKMIKIVSATIVISALRVKLDI